MSYVFVLDQYKQPCNPVHSAAARRLLTSGKAAVWRTFPFTILLKTDMPVDKPAPKRLKLDPGSKTTGIALIDDATGQVVWAAELTHRGQLVCHALQSRRATRRSRRQRHTRYRAPRFLNRTRPPGWLAPSLESRIKNVETWVARLRRLAPIGALSMELVRFDMQLMQDATVSGVVYQQGELVGYEIRQYLLEKWRRTCAYCGETGIPLEIEHITPRSRGGSDRVSNLTLACHACNQKKGNKTAAEFGYPELQAKAKQPLKDAAAVNSTRWRLFERLKATSLPVEVGSGGLTQFNRTQRGLDKTHWLDAACVGRSTPPLLDTSGIQPLGIKATGHGTRQMCRMDKYGFPRTEAKGARVVHGFKTGDMVKATVTRGSKMGTYVGRVAVRTTGSFNITTANAIIQGLHYRFFRAVQRADGYSYRANGIG